MFKKWFHFLTESSILVRLAALPATKALSLSLLDPILGLVTLVLAPGWASDWPVCVNVPALPTRELGTSCRCGPEVCVDALSMLSVFFCKSCQLFLSCSLPSKLTWQPEA